MNDSPVDLHARKFWGNLVSSRNASSPRQPSALTNQMNFAQNLNNHDEHLTKDQLCRLETPIKENCYEYPAPRLFIS